MHIDVISALAAVPPPLAEVATVTVSPILAATSLPRVLAAAGTAERVAYGAAAYSTRRYGSGDRPKLAVWRFLAAVGTIVSSCSVSSFYTGWLRRIWCCGYLLSVGAGTSVTATTCLLSGLSGH